MKIEIHNSTYVFLLLSFLSGYFEYIYLLLIIIFIHEFGHFVFGLLEGMKISKIIIYPFGGITICNEELNISLKKELFFLIGGITFQILFYLLIRKLYLIGLITIRVFNIITRINIILVSFNFLPVLPLDGGKLLNIILNKIFNYRLSNLISIIISILFTIIFLLYNKTLFSLLLSIFLCKCIIIEILNIKIKYNRFLLERYLNKYNFRKIRIINNINSLKRDYTHIINNNFESKILSKLFDRRV